MRTYLTAPLNIDGAGKDIGQVYSDIRDHYDLGGQTVTVHIGSETGGWTFTGPLVGAIGPQSFVIDGGGAPSTTISGSLYPFNLQNDAKLTIQNMTLGCNPGGACILVSEGVAIGKSLWFGPTGNAFADVCGPRSVFGGVDLTYLINSNPNIGFVAEDHGQIDLSGNHIVSGNPHWATAFVQADLGGMIDATGATFTPASCSGRRFNASSGGIVFTGTGSGNPNFFPGDVPGLAIGGFYS